MCLQGLCDTWRDSRPSLPSPSDWRACIVDNCRGHTVCVGSGSKWLVGWPVQSSSHLRQASLFFSGEGRAKGSKASRYSLHVSSTSQISSHLTCRHDTSSEPSRPKSSMWTSLANPEQLGKFPSRHSASCESCRLFLARICLVALVYHILFADCVSDISFQSMRRQLQSRTSGSCKAFSTHECPLVYVFVTYLTDSIWACFAYFRRPLKYCLTFGAFLSSILENQLTVFEKSDLAFFISLCQMFYND